MNFDNNVHFISNALWTCPLTPKVIKNIDAVKQTFDFNLHRNSQIVHLDLSHFRSKR